MTPEATAQLTRAAAFAARPALLIGLPALLLLTGLGGAGHANA